MDYLSLLYNYLYIVINYLSLLFTIIIYHYNHYTCHLSLLIIIIINNNLTEKHPVNQMYININMKNPLNPLNRDKIIMENFDSKILSLNPLK